jgi:hypothetical protein
VPVKFDVAIAQHSGSSGTDTWAHWESWATGFDPFTGTFPDPYTAPDDQGPFRTSYVQKQCGGVVSTVPVYCSGSPTGLQHLPNGGNVQTCDYSALPTATTDPSHVEAAGALSPAVFVGAGASYTTWPAVIPPASGTTPGLAVVYLRRTAGATRETPLTYQDWQNVDPAGTKTGWEKWHGDYWKVVGPDWCGTNPHTGTDLYQTDYPGYRHWSHLTAAKWTLTGSLSVTTQGTSGSTDFGDARAFITAKSFNRTVNN